MILSVNKNSFTRGQLFLDRYGQLAMFTGILCFWTELSWSYNQKQTYYGVLQTGSVFELFYEWTTTKKMKDPVGSTKVDGPNAEKTRRAKLKHSFQLARVKGRHR